MTTQGEIPEAEKTVGGRSLGSSNPTLCDLPFLTIDEAAAYLRLNTTPGDARERLRNLVRRHGLPMCKRGHLRLFRRDAIDAWLASPHQRRRRA